MDLVDASAGLSKFSTNLQNYRHNKNPNCLSPNWSQVDLFNCTTLNIGKLHPLWQTQGVLQWRPPHLKQNLPLTWDFSDIKTLTLTSQLNYEITLQTKVSFNPNKKKCHEIIHTQNTLRTEMLMGKWSVAWQIIFVLTSVNHLHECQRKGSSSCQILLLQIYSCPGSLLVTDGICSQSVPSHSCNHTWSICICGGQTEKAGEGVSMYKWVGGN